jgi:uncharacterized RDD family membrane protein YckC
MTKASKTQTYPPAGFFRRLGALFYDSLVVIALEMIAVGLVIAVLEALVAARLISYAPYIDAADMLTHHPILNPIFLCYIITVWVGFFVFFWTRAGQTLGMRAWKIAIQNDHGAAITITQSLIRLATSAFGLGNILALFDPQKRGFQDIWANTQLVVLPKAN